MKCKFCEKKLRKDNQIGTCRLHRPLSDSRKVYMKNYADSNVSKLASYKKTWAYVNKERLNLLCIKRREESPHVALAHALRTRIHRALKGNFKSSSVVKALGCSLEYFKEYIEKQFQSGMTWENHTVKGWHLDHIIPLCSVDLTDSEQYKKVCHYTNLRPLWAGENLRRKKNKLPRVIDTPRG
jgi:hypothetical protein